MGTKDSATSSRSSTPSTASSGSPASTPRVELIKAPDVPLHLDPGQAGRLGQRHAVAADAQRDFATRGGAAHARLAPVNTLPLQAPPTDLACDRPIIGMR